MRTGTSKGLIECELKPEKKIMLLQEVSPVFFFFLISQSVLTKNERQFWTEFPETNAKCACMDKMTEMLTTLGVLSGVLCGRKATLTRVGGEGALM